MPVCVRPSHCLALRARSAAAPEGVSTPFSTLERERVHASYRRRGVSAVGNHRRCPGDPSAAHRHGSSDGGGLGGAGRRRSRRHVRAVRGLRDRARSAHGPAVGRAASAGAPRPAPLGLRRSACAARPAPLGLRRSACADPVGLRRSTCADPVGLRRSGQPTPIGWVDVSVARRLRLLSLCNGCRRRRWMRCRSRS